MKFAPLSPNTHTIRISKAGGTTATLVVQLADTPDERGTGLMNRDCLPEDSGMLFAFPDDTTTSFRMRDTADPAVDRLHPGGRQDRTHSGHGAETRRTATSARPYRYAIEVSQGWFAENGVAPGDMADIAESFSANARTDAR